MNSLRGTPAGLKRAAHQLLLAIVLAGSTTGFSAEAQWQLRQDKQRIQVFTREVTGSDYLEVKATTIINAPVDKVVAALGDGSSCSKWRTLCKSSTVLNTVSEQERYIHQVLDLPWPIADRDLVIHSTTIIDPQSQSATVSVESTSKMMPPEDYVRAQSNGQFAITVVGEGQVEFAYIMHAELGGDLSPGIINSQLASSTFEDMKLLQALVEN
jgi:hypothetical protein